MMTTSTNPTNCGAVLAAAQPTEIIGAPAPSVNPIRDVLRESAGRVRTHIAAGFTAAGRELLNARVPAWRVAPLRRSVRHDTAGRSTADASCSSNRRGRRAA